MKASEMIEMLADIKLTQPSHRVSLTSESQ